MNVTEYTLKGCNLIRTDLLSLSSLSLISSPKDIYTIKLTRFNNFFSVLKNDTLFYFVKNNSITDDEFKINEDVVVDPAGLTYILNNNINGAGGGSGEIYNFLNLKSFDKNIINFFESKDIEEHENEKLYIKNNELKTDISPSKAGLYKIKDSKINIIHTVGPNFTNSRVLNNILNDDNESKLNELIYKIYESIFKEFVSLKDHKKLYLRLLPVSTGIYLPSKNKEVNLKKILNAIKIALFKLLNKSEYQHLIEKVSLYLYEQSEYREYKSLFE